MPRKNDPDRLPGKVRWFGPKGRFDTGCFDLLRPRRAVSYHERFRSGAFRSQKCGREIQYESALERTLVERLEANRHVVFYCEQPVRIPYRRGRRPLGYTPDYAICMDSGHFILAEVKDLPGMLDYRVQPRIEALMEFCAARGFGLLLTDGRHSPEHLMQGRINRRLEKELLAALAQGPLGEKACRGIMARCGATLSELCKAVIRHDLRFRPFPLLLRTGNGPSPFREAYFGRKRPAAPHVPKDHPPGGTPPFTPPF